MLYRIIRYSVNEFAYNEGLIGRYAGFVISREDCIQRSEVADNFVHKGILKKDMNSGMRIFGEPYEGDW